MKKFFLLILTGLFVSGAMAQDGYTIRGSIIGDADGMKVYLRDNDWYDPKTVDSAVIKDGTFLLKGKVDYPALYSLVIDKTPKGAPSSERNWTMSRFYVENSNITFTGNIDSLPGYFYSQKPVQQAIIEGSATETESKEFKKSLEGLRKAQAALSEQYMKLYHLPALEGTFNTSTGMALVKAQNIVAKEIEAQKWNFIKEHASSPVAYDEAYYYLIGMYVDLTAEQIDSLTRMVAKGWGNTPRMEAFRKAAEKAKRTAIGSKFQDFQLLTPDGKKVRLSEYVPEGKYVMLEFWASWCGPCRGEIPHLREVNKKKSDNFQIVSISLDEDDAEWKTAMKEEQMIWPQLVDYKGFESEIAQAYNIMGIPFSILLDKEGRIIDVNLRGAALDVALEKL